MNEMTDEQWQRIRQHFGDVAYEHPEMADMMLEIVEQLETVGFRAELSRLGA